MTKSNLFNDYYIIISKTACATKKLFNKKVASAKFCNNNLPSTLQYDVSPSFRSHLTDENCKNRDIPFLNFCYRSENDVALLNFNTRCTILIKVSQNIKVK